MKSDFILDQIMNSGVKGEVFIRLKTDEQLPLKAGQLWFGVYDPLEELLPTGLYTAMDEQGEWYLAGAVPAGWQTGIRLTIQGPVGSGFNLPPAARRVVCVSLDERAHYLMPVMLQALALGAEVVFAGEQNPLRLPELVEVFGLERWEEWWDWADYIAVQGSLPAAAAFFQKIDRQKPSGIKRAIAEVLIRQSVFCGGMAECGVCAVPLRRGLSLICRHGPVFDAFQVDWLADGLQESGGEPY